MVKKINRIYRAYEEDGEVTLECYSVDSGVKVYHWEIDLCLVKDIPLINETLRECFQDYETTNS